MTPPHIVSIERLGAPANSLEGLRTRLDSLQKDFAALRALTSADAADVLALALREPLPGQIRMAAASAERRLDVRRDLEDRLKILGGEYQRIPGYQFTPNQRAEHARLGADISELALAMKPLLAERTAALRELLARRTPDLLASARSHLRELSGVVGAAFAVLGLLYTVAFYWLFGILVLSYVNSLTDFLLMGVAHATIVIVILAICGAYLWWQTEVMRRAATSPDTSITRVASLLLRLDLRRRQPVRLLSGVGGVVVMALLLAAGANALLLAYSSEDSIVYTRSGPHQRVKVLGTVANYVFVHRPKAMSFGAWRIPGKPLVLRADEVRCVVPYIEDAGKDDNRDDCAGNPAPGTQAGFTMVRVDGDASTSWRRFARETMECDPVDHFGWDRHTADSMILGTPFFADDSWQKLDAGENARHSIDVGCGDDPDFTCLARHLRWRLDSIADASGGAIQSFAFAGFASATNTPEHNLLLSLFRAQAIACLVADQVADSHRSRCTDEDFVRRFLVPGPHAKALTYTPRPGAKPIELHVHAMGETLRPPEYIGKEGDASDRRVLAIACRRRTASGDRLMFARSNYPAAPATAQEVLDVERQFVDGALARLERRPGDVRRDDQVWDSRRE